MIFLSSFLYYVTMDADSKNKRLKQDWPTPRWYSGVTGSAVLPKKRPFCNSQGTDKCFIDGNSCKNCVSLEMF